MSAFANLDRTAAGDWLRRFFSAGEAHAGSKQTYIPSAGR